MNNRPWLNDDEDEDEDDNNYDVYYYIKMCSMRSPPTQSRAFVIGGPFSFF